MNESREDPLPPDDRILCAWCRRYDKETYRCRQLNIGMPCERPLRCMHYVPNSMGGDQRTGRERWPTMPQDIEDVRQLEKAYRERGKKR